MITEIRHKNFKALRDATLPLGRFTLIVGANGTGKTTALKALSQIEEIDKTGIENDLTKGLNEEKNQIQIEVFWDTFSHRRTVLTDQPPVNHHLDKNQNILGGSSGSFANSLDWTYGYKSEGDALRRFRVFAFDAEKIAEATTLKANVEIESDGKIWLEFYGEYKVQNRKYLTS